MSNTQKTTDAHVTEIIDASRDVVRMQAINAIADSWSAHNDTPLPSTDENEFIRGQVALVVAVFGKGNIWSVWCEAQAAVNRCRFVSEAVAA